MLSVKRRPALNASELWSTDMSTMTMPRIQSRGARRSVLVVGWTIAEVADGTGASAGNTSGTARKSECGMLDYTTQIVGGFIGPARKCRVADRRSGPRIDHQLVDERVHRHGLQPSRVTAKGEDVVALFERETPSEVGAELCLEQGDPLRTTTTVADGVFDRHLAGLFSILESDLQLVRDRALFRIVVVA